MAVMPGSTWASMCVMRCRSVRKPARDVPTTASRVAKRMAPPMVIRVLMVQRFIRSWGVSLIIEPVGNAIEEEYSAKPP